jgi:hypothetical protein
VKHLLPAGFVLTLLGVSGLVRPPTHGDVQFVFTSDAHYGTTRGAFRRASNVDAHVVNQAMVGKINTLADTRFPTDGGLMAGEIVGPLDFLVEGGDVANRSEVTGTNAIQSAAVSWSQFRTDYIEGLRLTNHAGARTPVYVVPGNHDASNAIGFYRPMRPLVDKTAMAEIYNLMMTPSARRTVVAYDYATDKVLSSRDIGGIHFVFLTVWPDSNGRNWLERDLGHLTASTPVIVFAHDQPDAQTKHFTNPNGNHDINSVDRFENLLSDRLADGSNIEVKNLIEQGAWEDFVRKHPNITAYFHGNSNWNEFYDWAGPHHSIALHTFRVDSPMKGDRSSKDETRLSFQVATIDSAARTMTVRECLWNATPHLPSALTWGDSSTVSLRSSRW